MATGGRNGARRILVADDDSSIRQLIKTFLHGEGYAIQEASSGAEILERLNKSDKPELVLMDVRMPDGNGIEVLQKLKAEQPDVGAILMTAYGTANTAIQAIQMGAF